MWGKRLFARLVTLIAVVGTFAIPAIPGENPGVVRQLTDARYEGTGLFLALDDAGQEIFANMADNVFGQNDERNWQIVRMPVDGTPGGPVVPLTRGTSPHPAMPQVSASDDGEWVLFVSRSDPLAANHDRSEELFVARRDGTELTQLTNDPGPSAGSVQIAAICGDGTRAVFTSTSDLTGENPQHVAQLFVASRDGSDLRQLLPSTSTGAGLLGISDDGEKIAFASNDDPFGTNPDGGVEVFAILADGTGLRQLTESPEGYSGDPTVSGNGQSVAFYSDANLQGLNPLRLDEVWLIEWDGTGLTRLTESINPYGFPAFSYAPSIVDDASWIYFASSQGTQTQNPDGGTEIWKVRRDGTDLTLLTNQNQSDGSCIYPEVSGSGNRVAFILRGQRLSGVHDNPDGSDEIAVMDSDGSGKRVLTDIVPHQIRSVDAAADGETIVFPMSLGYVSPDEYRGTEIFRMDRDGGGLFQITDENSAYDASITLDGSTIAYDATDGLYTIRTDGTERTPLSEFGIHYNPSIAGDGSLIFFDSTDDKTGANPDGSVELFSVLPDGTGLTQVTDGPTGTASEFARLDGTGTWLVFRSTANHTGENSDGSAEAFLMRSDGSEMQQLSHMPPGGSAGGG